MKRCRYFLAVVPMLVSMVWAQPQFTQNASLSRLGELDYIINNMVMLAAIFLIFLLLLGIVLLEAGLNQRCNSVHAFVKAFIGLTMSTLVMWLVGYNWLYAEGHRLIGSGWMLAGLETGGANGGIIPLTLHLLCEIMMLAVILAVISAASSGRLKLMSYSLLAFFVSLLYPLVMRFAWQINLGMTGFTLPNIIVYHLLAGGAALAIVLALGARTGRYASQHAKQRLLLPANLGMAAVGSCLSLLGWCGFFVAMVLLKHNHLSDSLLHQEFSNITNPAVVDYVSESVVYMLLMLAATLSTTALGLLLFLRRLDLSLLINTLLASMVVFSFYPVTEGLYALCLGAGVALVSMLCFWLLDSLLHVDDPVGVIVIHLVLPLLALGIVAITDFTTVWQIFAFAAGVIGSTFVFSIIVKGLIGLRPTPEKEMQGMDVVTFGYRGERA